VAACIKAETGVGFNGLYHIFNLKNIENPDVLVSEDHKICGIPTYFIFLLISFKVRSSKKSGLRRDQL
jgi:hypothetical protein